MARTVACVGTQPTENKGLILATLTQSSLGTAVSLEKEKPGS